MTPFELAQHGWHLVPWTNRHSTTRQPLVKDFLKNRPSPKTIEGWARQWPDCDWAIVPQDHVVLDIEMKNGKDGEADLKRLEAQFGPLPTHGPQTRSFTGGGRHIWLRLPDGCELRGGAYIGEGKGIEIKCRSGSVHIPPSHGYTPINAIGAYENCPMAPDWVIDLWSKAKPVGRVLPEGEKYGMGERHAGLCSFAGKLRNLGLSEEGIYQGLVGARHDKCEDPESVSDEELRGIAKSYAVKEADSFELRVERKEQEALSVENFFSRKVVVIARPAPTEADTPVLSGSDLRPTPLIAEWVDWVVSNADRPQHELSLLSACVGLAGLIGRNLTWSHSHANLYGLGLATSGSGKNTPLHSIEKVYCAAGFEDLLGASRIGSDAGMLCEMSAKPNILWPLDEVAILLNTFQKGQTPAYIDGIKQYLLEWYTCSPHRGIALKDAPTKAIPNPYPNIMAFAQPATFQKAYTDEMAENGLLGRFSIFLGEDLPRKNFYAVRTPPPITLIEAIKKACAAQPQIFSTIGTPRQPAEIAAAPDVIAHRIMRDGQIEDELALIKSTEPLQATLLSRTMEKSNKFALIHAWSLNPLAPMMTKESVDWGITITRYTNACMLKLLATKKSGPQEEAVSYVLSAIEAKGSAGVSPSKLIGFTRRLERTKRESILRDLIESGRVLAQKKKNTRGPDTLAYISTNFAKKEHAA